MVLLLSQEESAVQVNIQGVPTWLGILTLCISLFALGISALQYLMNREEAQQNRPNISVNAVFSSYAVGYGTAEGVPAVAVSIRNTGREPTSLLSMVVHSKSMVLNGKNNLLEASTRGERDWEIPAYSSRQFGIDAARIEDEKVTLECSFGHGRSIRQVLTLDTLSKPKSSKRWRKGVRSRTEPKILTKKRRQVPGAKCWIGRLRSGY